MPKIPKRQRSAIPEHLLELKRQGMCPICRKPKSEWTRRTDWSCCSLDCTKEMVKQLREHDWAFVRAKCIKRDDSTCRMCGKKSFAIQIFHRASYETNMDECENLIKARFRDFEIIERSPDWLRVKVYGNGEGVVVDHIQPIALGGPEFDLDNLQVLCEACNKIKTAGDIQKIAEVRRINRKLADGQTQIYIGDKLSFAKILRG